MTISQYLGRGTTSRGRAVINGGLSMSVGTLPYLQTAGDIAAVVAGVAHMQTILSTIKGLTWQFPSAGQSASDYVSAVRPSHLSFSSPAPCHMPNPLPSHNLPPPPNTSPFNH